MLHKSNKWDAARDIISTESRQWDLWHHEREKGQYTKRKLEYWESGISQRRKQQRAASASTSLPQDTDEICDEIQDYKKMTIVQLREIIKGERS